MLGLPGQTMADWRDTLDAALSLAPQHISCYALIVEEGTPLAAQLARGEITLPGEDAERAMYGAARDILRAHGFHQYEISNFALPGEECRHNANCWRREDYLGFGCAAHSLWRNTRRANPAELAAYLRGDAPETEQISPDDAMFESLMLGLRLTQGHGRGGLCPPPWSRAMGCLWRAACARAARWPADAAGWPPIADRARHGCDEQRAGGRDGRVRKAKNRDAHTSVPVLLY